MSSQLMVATGRLKIEHERRMKARQEKRKAAAENGDRAPASEDKKEK